MARAAKVDGPIRKNVGGFVEVSITIFRWRRKLDDTFGIGHAMSRPKVFYQSEVTNGVQNQARLVPLDGETTWGHRD